MTVFIAYWLPFQMVGQFAGLAGFS